MRKAVEISPEDARYLALHNQLLLDNHPAKTKKDLLGIIEKLGYVQIDTISIIERAHKHVLWTRFPGYTNGILDELVDKDKKVLEFWDHAAAYIPMKYYRFTLPRKRMYEHRHSAWGKKNKKLLSYITERIGAEGPLQSRDFEDPSKRGLWWDWKPAKEGLEYLFHTGRLSVKARKSFQKVYDLTERVLPGNINDSFPSDEELSAHLIMKEINANGFASEKEMTYLRHHSRAVTKKVLNEMLEDKKIVQLTVKGIEGVYYTVPSLLRQLNLKKDDRHIHILSPFDNLVIQRKRLKTLFNFDYVIECYLPAPKRKFGYFCMPVLFGDKFICRIDAKADRAAGVFKIINIFWEKGFESYKAKRQFKNALMKKISSLAEFSGCRKTADFTI